MIDMREKREKREGRPTQADILISVAACLRGPRLSCDLADKFHEIEHMNSLDMAFPTGLAGAESLLRVLSQASLVKTSLTKLQDFLKGVSSTDPDGPTHGLLVKAAQQMIVEAVDLWELEDAGIVGVVTASAADDFNLAWEVVEDAIKVLVTWSAGDRRKVDCVMANIMGAFTLCLGLHFESGRGSWYARRVRMCLAWKSCQLLIEHHLAEWHHTVESVVQLTFHVSGRVSFPCGSHPWTKTVVRILLGIIDMPMLPSRVRRTATITVYNILIGGGLDLLERRKLSNYLRAYILDLVDERLREYILTVIDTSDGGFSGWMIWETGMFDIMRLTAHEAKEK